MGLQLDLGFMTSSLTKFLIELMPIKRRKEKVFFSEGLLLVLPSRNSFEMPIHNTIAVSGPTEHCPIFHFPPPSVLRSSVTGVTY